MEVVVGTGSELMIVLLGVGVVDGEATELAAEVTAALDGIAALDETAALDEARLGVGVLAAAVDTTAELDKVVATACEEEEEEEGEGVGVGVEAATVEYEVEQTVVAGARN